MTSQNSSDTIEVEIRYFAILREQSGCSSEKLRIIPQTSVELYEELRRRYHFTLNPNSLRVAVNDEFRDWQTPLQNDDVVVFIPPVAGG